MYDNISKFINDSNERIFNDRLMIMTIIEIMLKSGCINDELILPRYYSKDEIYDGEKYERAGMIKNVVPKKALAELKNLVSIGSKINFDSKASVKVWIQETTGISHSSLSVY